MTIGILYICTGKYVIFWKNFFESCEKYFFPGHEKKYYVFTDAKSIYGDRTHINIFKQRQKNLGWPLNTLMRFNMFTCVKDELLAQTDYCFFFNANAEIKSRIGHEILPEIKENFLVGALHPSYVDKNPQVFPYDRNELSESYIPLGSGTHYFQGGFNGGRTREYLTLIEKCRMNTEKDLKNNIVAVWHDESHINRYFLDLPPKILNNSYNYPENYTHIPLNPIIVMRDKNKFGGHSFLRSDEKTLNLIMTKTIRIFKRVTKRILKFFVNHYFFL